MSEARTASSAKRKRIFVYLSASVLLLLIAIGVFGRNGWLPRTDAMTGEKFGWFGSKLPKNAGSTWNPLAAPLPNPTPQLAKEYIYAGSRMLAVVDANANETPPADLAVWRPSSGVWWVLGSSSTPQYAQAWGLTGDEPVPGDYDGDGKTDFSIFRNSTGEWYVLRSSDNAWMPVLAWGLSSDKRVAADFDGDGKTDRAVWRPSDGTWYIVHSSTGLAVYQNYGTNGDVPAPADYDGDGRADIAVFRPSNTTYYSINTSNSAPQAVALGAGTASVGADYDGDGKADYAVRSGANWIIKPSSGNTAGLGGTVANGLVTVPWQESSDIAVHNDYDGDGKTDIAVWRPTDSPTGTLGNWFIRQSGLNNTPRTVQWGILYDIPVPAFWRR
ncbi:MAG: VCBS repeat-containing protein [Blastocatellia bacterium]|nr:VCBS repeat-containing protein [Blastocatellia bacterium]